MPFAVTNFQDFNEAYVAYQTLLDHATSLCYVSCNNSLQNECCTDLENFVRSGSRELRLKLNVLGDKEGVKKLIVLEAQLTAIFHELACLLLLKSNEAEKAWDHLVLAQECVKVVGRFFGNAEGQFDRLRVLEVLLFPQQSFMSVGIIVQESECNICTGNYEICDHVAGEIYGAEVCQRTITKCDLKETSLLGHKEPKDRRCRVTHISRNGVKINLMTRETEPSDKNETILYGYAARY